MSVRRSRWCVGLAVPAAIFLAAGVRAPRPDEEPTCASKLTGPRPQPRTLDRPATPSAVTYQIIASVTENLLFRGTGGKLTPWLAESWSVARDGRSVTFKLRRDVKFHDGTP